MVKQEEAVRQTIDKKRLFIAIVIITFLIGIGGVWAKNNLPKQNSAPASGQVEGIKDKALGIEEQKQEIQKKIEEIKGDIVSLKPEDIKEQEPVKKILSDLDELKDKATESAKIFDIKGNLCEEAKKRFCE